MVKLSLSHFAKNIKKINGRAKATAIRAYGKKFHPHAIKLVLEQGRPFLCSFSFFFRQ